MVSAPTIIFCAAVFALLGCGWVKGYDLVKGKAPQMLAKFYLAYAVFRVLTVLVLASVYIFFLSGSVAESKAFVAMLFVMYAVMMALTLKMKH